MYRAAACLKLIPFKMTIVLLLGLRAVSLVAGRSVVKLANDGLHHGFQLLPLGLELFQAGVLVRLHPLDLLRHGFLHGLLVLRRQLPAQLLLVAQLGAQGVGVALQVVAGVHALPQPLVVVGEALGLLHHAPDVVARQAVLLVGDGDPVRVAVALVLGRDAQDAVDVELEGDLDLGDAARGRGDVGQGDQQHSLLHGQGQHTWSRSSPPR